MRNPRILTAAVVGVLMSTLTACGGDANDNTVNCDNVIDARSQLDEFESTGPSDDRDDMLAAWGFDPNGENGFADATRKIDRIADDCRDDAQPADDNTDEPKEDSTEKADGDCKSQFVQRDLTDNQRNRLKKGGIDASTAEKASNKNLAMLGHQAELLRSVAQKQFGLTDLPREDNMVTASGDCLSEAGQRVHHDLAVVMDASAISFGQAPVNGVNSGAENGDLVVSSNPGITGDRKAVVYTLPNGSKAYTMLRCGNPVFMSKPKGVPVGKTDNPPPPPPPKNPPPDGPPTVNPPPPDGGGCEYNCGPVTGKDPSEDPYPNGNAPTGGGHNDTDGPGTPNPKPTFQEGPRDNPPPPSGGGGGGSSSPPSGSTPDDSNNPPPPAESGSNPDNGGDNTGDPGTDGF